MAKMRIEGSFVALVTPFNEDGSTLTRRSTRCR